MTAPDQSLIRVLARAHQGLDRMNSDPELTLAELAREEGFNRSYVSRLIRLILLAPDYDGGKKAWVRWPDGSDDIVPGSQVQA